MEIQWLFSGALRCVWNHKIQEKFDLLSCEACPVLVESSLGQYTERNLPPSHDFPDHYLSSDSIPNGSLVLHGM